MKLLLLALFSVPTIVVAQHSKDNQAKYYLNRLHHFGTEIDMNDFNYVGTDVRWEDLKEKGIQSLTIERGKNQNKTTSVHYVFNDRGRIKMIEHPKDTVHYAYVQDSLIQSIKQTGRKEKLSSYEYANGLLTKKEVFENERLSSRVLMDYTEDEKIAFSLLQSGRKLKSSYAMDYEYENGKVKRQQFIRNDKIIRTWDYTCEPKGEAQDQKTTSTLCTVVEENNDGSYVNHIRKVENGEVLLYAHYFDKDSVNYASTCEKETGEKVWSTKKENNVRTSMSYDQKGKLRSKTVWTFGENEKVVEVKHTFGKRQNRESSMKYAYNTDGLLVSKTSFYKGKESYVRKYIYHE